LTGAFFGGGFGAGAATVTVFGGAFRISVTFFCRSVISFVCC